MRLFFKFLCCCVFLAVLIIVPIDNLNPPNPGDTKDEKLAPCQTCKAVVESFRKGMDRTSRGKFEGGDTDWEEKKLGSYMQSEVRLVEIQEGLCRDLTRGESQCHDFVESYEQLIEEWYFTEQKNEPDLHKYLCIDKAKVCCPNKHYGPFCTPCFGFPDNICSNNGKCKGNGTRKGNGKCACDPGYTGEICDICSDGYFQLYKDDNKILCDKCHMSCLSTCTESGPRGCLECAKGWYKDDKGCVDVNECVKNPNICQQNQFCVNKEGSYQCLQCDRACNGCTGDGPDMCVKCAQGYDLQDNFCIDTSGRKRDSYVNLTRYLTYLGLCLATCIIFQRSMVVAGVIGLAVGIYISVSEYMLSTQNQQIQMPIDISNLQDLFQ